MGLTGSFDAIKSFLKTVAWHLRKTEDGRRRYLVEVVVQELRWVRDRVTDLDEKYVVFMREEFPDLVLAALQKAERTRSKERVIRMGKVLGASAKNGPTLIADEVEELLRISMDLDDTDVKVLSLSAGPAWATLQCLGNGHAPPNQQVLATRSKNQRH